MGWSHSTLVGEKDEEWIEEINRLNPELRLSSEELSAFFDDFYRRAAGNPTKTS